MRRWGKNLVCMALVVGLAARAESSVETAEARAAQSREAGEFTAAAGELSDILRDPNLSASERQKIEYQIDLLQRVRHDYALTADQLFQQLSKAVRDVTRPEFNQWIAQGRFDKMKIDGVDYFVDVSVSNLFFRYPELASRRLDGKSSADEQRARLKLARAITRAAREAGTPYVLPHSFRCAMTVAAESDAAPAGALIRAWLPIPRRYPFQNDFSVIDSSSPIKEIAPESSPIRSAYLEQFAQAGEPTTFQITYSYTTLGVSFALDPANVRSADLSDPALRKFTLEAPHVVFSEKIKALAGGLANGSTNPVIQAKAFYDWIGANVKYSFAREYSTLTNISDYCLTHRYGDCGQEALLFITLCRSEGIPARWQSGWNIFPGAKDIHDWTEIYLAPYGWVPVDPWAGLFATQYCDALSPAERQELHDFYFGGLDPYRMAANSDHSQTLQPPKKTPRSDDVDFQRGELESGDKNIYFDKFSCHLNVEELHEAR